MKTAKKTFRFWVVIIAGGVFGSCGDGGSSSQPPPVVPAVCQTAFDTGGASSSRPALQSGVSAELDPVALSSCTKDAQGNVVIGGSGGCGPNVVVDKDLKVGKITINSSGKLVFPDLADPELKAPKTLQLETTGILIADGGLFGVGTAACPIGFHEGARATITFTGDRLMTCDPTKGCDDGSVKGIEVRPGGMLRMFGAKGVPNPSDPGAGPGGVSWTALRETAAAGSRTLALAVDVTKGQRPWEKDDWIVVGTTSFSPFESEFVQIADAPTADGMGGSRVQLMQPLQYSHFGSEAPTPSQLCTVEGKRKAVACGSVAGCTAPCTAAPSALNFNDPAAKNYGIDERAEVGLITRSIKLTATTPAPPPADQEPLKPDASLHWGGEIRIVGGESSDPAPHVEIVGVELEKFGKDQLGSYPIHMHMVGDKASASLINANSIHHSFNKCITVHMSSKLTFADNVCARIVGHIFYEEFGSEENLTFERNLGLGAMSNSFDIYKVTTVPPTVKVIPRGDLIRDYWWKGDNLAKGAGYNYDGFNIPNTDEQSNPTYGSCKTATFSGDPTSQRFPPPACPPVKPPQLPAPTDELYAEPASGFWITNPTTKLIGNSIGGCQGVGRAFWWVTPKQPITINGETVDLKYKPLGAFADNRGHGCYAGFYGEDEYGVSAETLFPHKDGTSAGQPIIAEMNGMTATRNRFRGVWFRIPWVAVTDGRFATNRESVSLVTSGGIDGNGPGSWGMLKDSVLAGISANNVDRFGPCPKQNALGQFTGGKFGCIDHTPPHNVCVSGTNMGKRCLTDAQCCANPADCKDSCPSTAHSVDEVGQGYPSPDWNMFGYMLYDGPVRVFDVRFVNYRKDPTATVDSHSRPVANLLTQADTEFLKTQSTQNTPTAQVCVSGPNKFKQCQSPADCCANAADCPDSCPLAFFVYEGDAALGWFQSNQSSYPTGTVSRGLSFENTDLRHQIYTDKVSVNLDFNDGDKNTAVIDEDGTLTGYGVDGPHRCSNAPAVGCTIENQASVCPVGGVCQTTTEIYPISLNNLPFNATSNSVDECFSRGAQNEKFEARDTSLISPGSLGTLEFSTLHPYKGDTFPGENNSHTQFITFKRDDLSPGAGGVMFHPEMTLHSRDGKGVWEPKVTSGFGYTATVAPVPTSPKFPLSTGKAGVAPLIDVGVADVVKPNISATDPFFVRLGICYTSEDGSFPQDPGKFTITRGYKSYTGGNVDPNDPELLKYWTPSECHNLDVLNPPNVTEPTCPAPRQRVKAKPNGQDCPPGSTASGDGMSCIFPTDVIDRVESPAQMLKPDGSPDLETFTYDKATGMLFLWVAQDEPNPIAPSPLGSCTGDPKTDNPICPDVAKGETYYACPVKGCHIYMIKLDDPNYVPGASKCQPYETYTHAPFAAQGKLVLAGTKTVVEQVAGVDKFNDPFHTPDATTDPKCEETVVRLPGMAELSASAPAGLPDASAEGSTAPMTSVDGAPAPAGSDSAPGVEAHPDRVDTAPAESDGDWAAGFAPRPTPTATPVPMAKPMPR
jgi:G8 domain